MTPKLPDILTRYFAAQNRHDIETLLGCFAPDAVVHDEGRDIVGSAEIRAWKLAASAKYQVTAEPIDVSAEGDRTRVVARVSGNFKGSPANLTYRFGFAEDGRIGALDIH